MKAEYDSEANAVLITLAVVPEGAPVPSGIEVHPRANVTHLDSRPIDVEVLYPELGIVEPLAAAAERYELDLQALKAAARSAIEAPDRVVTLEVSMRS